MGEDFLTALQENGTDIYGAIERLAGDKESYEMILKSFPEDPTMFDLEKALKTSSWDDAFTASHALKGLAGNLGLTPLFHSLGELVISIRAGRISEIGHIFDSVKYEYCQIVAIIKEYN